MSKPSSIEICNYLHLAKALQTVEQRPFWMMFDAEADFCTSIFKALLRLQPIAKSPMMMW